MSPKKKSFEEALSRIEEIVNLLEKEMNSLDESIKLYEEGMKLIKFCESELKKAEGKVTQLVKDQSGETVEKPFPLSEESEE